MPDSKRSLIVAGTVTIVAFAALSSYIHDQRQRQIAQAKIDYFVVCTQKTHALLEASQEREVSAVVEKAGLSPNLFRLNMIDPAVGHAALERAGLLDEFTAAVARQKELVKGHLEKSDQGLIIWSV